MPLGQSLGVQLRLREAERDAAEQEAARLKAAAEQRRITKERDQIREILEQARQDAIEAVAENRAVKGVKVKGYGMPFSFRPHGAVHSVTIDSGYHPYNDIYREFAAWGQSEGVLFKVSDEHDGVGMGSWHRVTVVPV